jgi:hypothetical protein
MVNFALRLVVEAQRGNRGIALLFSNLDISCGWVVKVTHRPFFLLECPCTHFNAQRGRKFRQVLGNSYAKMQCEFLFFFFVLNLQKLLEIKCDMSS